MKEECQCNRIMGRDEKKTVYVHIYGCPKDGSREEYQKLKWWQKLFTKSPQSLYLENFRP